MKAIALIILGGLFVSGCAHWFVEPFPGLIETEKQLVGNCEMLGVVVETANASNAFSLAAEENMLLRVRERAGILGASHIVWLHKTATSATAEAYQCPQP